MRRLGSNSRNSTVTSCLPIGKSLSASRSMLTTTESPTADTGCPSALWSMPEESTATCPCGSQSTSKIAPGAAGITRWTSMPSVMIVSAVPSPSMGFWVFAGGTRNHMTNLHELPTSGHRPPGLQRSVAFIHENADSDIGLAEIAAAANLTPRAVQYMYRRHLGVTPLEYLRRVRLDLAHRDLQAATPRSTPSTRSPAVGASRTPDGSAWPIDACTAPRRARHCERHLSAATGSATAPASDDLAKR